MTHQASSMPRAIIFDVADAAQELETVLRSSLPAYPLGYYLPNQAQPTLRVDQSYYHYDAIGNKQIPIDLSQLGNVKQDIYDETGDVVLSIRNPNIDLTKSLSLSPTYPVKGVEMILQYFDIFLLNRTKWNKTPARTFEHAVYMQLENTFDSSFQITEEFLEYWNQRLREYITDLVIFTRDGEWNMYMTHSKNTDITVVRGDDYRIIDWMRRTKSGQWM